jgi:hypothetical protein
MIGDSTMTCIFDGNWDRDPPLFEPVIQCNVEDITKNLSSAKNFKFFNETKVAVIDSKIVFQCKNWKNSSKILVSLCGENGFWIGDDFKCKFGAKIK